MAKKKDTKSITELDMALEVSNTIDIKDILLTESHCKLFGIASSPGEHSYDISATTNYEVREKDKILLTQTHLKFRAKNPKNEKLGFLEAVYLVVYSLKTEKSFSDDRYIHFADYCSVFHVWPYWREFVQRSIAGMGLPPLTLPVYKFGSKLSKEESLIQKKMLEQTKAEKPADAGATK
jgi:preprotein translocase subunit SecB